MQTSIGFSQVPCEPVHYLLCCLGNADDDQASRGQAALRPSPLTSSHPVLREGDLMTAPVIAILDNDPDVLSLIHELLADEGYRTLRCRPDDVVSAHALVKHVRPALVVLDLWLAERDSGWAFLKHLWGDTETTHIPALIVTGEPVLLPMHAAVLYAKHCPVMKKPFDLQDLLAAITAVLGPSPAQRDCGPHLYAISSADPPVPNLPGYPLVAAGGIV
jgi:CheY-like chemotaxis protein